MFRVPTKHESGYRSGVSGFTGGGGGGGCVGDAIPALPIEWTSLAKSSGPTLSVDWHPASALIACGSADHTVRLVAMDLPT